MVRYLHGAKWAQPLFIFLFFLDECGFIQPAYGACILLTLIPSTFEVVAWLKSQAKLVPRFPDVQSKMADAKICFLAC